MMSGEHSVTSEETPPGSLPKWLLDQMKLQSLNSPISDSGIEGRILVIYPNENSRNEAFEKMGLSGAIERTLHHTIDSLISSLTADFRIPRVFSTEGAFEIVLHEECKLEASKFGFPLINPLPQMYWGRRKTEDLSKLHRCLSNELLAEKWDGPGIQTFRKILQKLEKRMGGTHPDFLAPRIIQALKEGSEPFTISDIDGIVMINHAPGLSKSNSEILLALSLHRPIHQLAYPGNFRLGEHGHLLLDEHPISSHSDLPNWIIKDRFPEDQISDVKRIILQREEDSFDAALEIVKDRLISSEDQRIMIVDPSIASNQIKWKRSLADLGVFFPGTKSSFSEHHLGHWIVSLANLPHGADSFSLDSLRTFSIQKSIPLFKNPPTHPAETELRPRANPDLLSSIARNEHVLGGPGALERWLSTLSKTPSDNLDGLEKESTQWWLLCVANFLRPLLTTADKAALDNSENEIGCMTGKKLPMAKPESSGDSWFLELITSIDLLPEAENMESNSVSSASAIQTIFRHHSELRNLQDRAGQIFPTTGPEWVDEFTSLANSSIIRGDGPISKDRVTLTSPSESLGCTSDLTIVANLSSSSWDLRAKRIPLLSEEDRHSFGISRPDAPIRDARHHLRHLLHSSPEVIILDPSLDENSPPSAPIREWAADSNQEGKSSIFSPVVKRTISPRDFRQLDGRKIRRNEAADRSPINPNSISIGFDLPLQRDRERRQPKFPESDGYLPEEAKSQILSFDKRGLSATNPDGIEPPRTNKRWPVIGGTFPGGRKSISIDPRPLTPDPSGLMVSDSRHGFLPGAEQKSRIWSPTRLQKWLDCPRMGWLSKGLMSENEEILDEDVDLRTRGKLLHSVHHDILSKVLGLKIGAERDLDPSGTISIHRSGLSEKELMQIALESLDSKAPWLERSDAASIHRLRSLTAMSLNDWGNWLADPLPINPRGRIGTIVSSESKCADSYPISLEWSTDNYNRNGIEISLPEELIGRNQSPPIFIRGFIDRVDVLPFDIHQEKWVNSDGSSTVAPLRCQGTGWKPQRIIAIRDLKISETASGKRRHRKGLLDELQLALYARAWEIAHPGDLVVAAGISLFGHQSEHYLELSPFFSESQKEHEIGTLTSVTTELFRFMDEDSKTQSDPFRAWMTHRIAVALKVAFHASNGRVNPTPSTEICSYCPVSNICNVRLEGSY